MGIPDAFPEGVRDAAATRPQINIMIDRRGATPLFCVDVFEWEKS